LLLFITDFSTASKPEIAPTSLQELEAIKTCDIHPSHEENNGFHLAAISGKPRDYQSGFNYYMKPLIKFDLAVLKNTGARPTHLTK
jgi:hypothetical protein